MLKTYVYNDHKNNWLEEHHLLLHDLCALFDEDDKIIYLWNGPKSTTERLEKGYEAMVDLISNYPDASSLQLTILTEDIPANIQKKLDKMLEIIRKEEQEEIYKFTRLWSIQLYFILNLIVVILPLISLMNLSIFMAWPTSNGNVKADAEIYNIWLGVSMVLTIICLIIFIINTGIGILEQEDTAIVFSVIGLIVCIGILIYLNQGIYLFKFQEGHTSTKYIISLEDLNLFLIINLIGILVFEIPNAYKLIQFFITYRDYIISR